jgi:hypothetical protein
MRRPLLLSAALLAALPSSALAATVAVPIDVGVGPVAYTLTGPVADDQAWHFGLKLALAAVLDRETIKRNERRIPPRYRKLAQGVDEARISPSVLIPDAILLSPKVRHTGIYGATWRPFGVGMPLTKGPVRLSVGAGLLLTYAFLHSDRLPSTHFLRPGVDIGAQVEIAFSRAFLTSFGWSSGFYIPQALGEFGLAPTREAMWHFGHAFLRFHVRFPYRARL